MYPNDTTNEIPHGYCHCGCGQKTKEASKTQQRNGHIQGEPLQFLYQHHHRRPLTERFWKFVNVTGPDACWLWQGAISGRGYGTIRIDGKTVLAHRTSWELNHGPIPDGMLVCHSCDVRACINPHHLFLGTQSDNARDRDRKGRDNRPRGARHPWAKLSEEQIADVCRLAASGIDTNKIAKTFNMSYQGIRNVLERSGVQHFPIRSRQKRDSHVQ